MRQAATLVRVAPAAALVLAGCIHANDQSVLHPAGPAAAEIAWLWWLMLGAFSGVFVIVVVLLSIAIFRRPLQASASNTARPESEGAEPWLGRTGFIVAGGVVLPVIVLTPLYIASLQSSAALRQPPESLTIRVVGHMWWWEVRYPELGIVTANEIHIPAGKSVRFELASADVIHSFWVPRLHGKRDMIPGIETEFWLQADSPGIYRGQCAEYCGMQHANMALHVIALSPGDFETWKENRINPPAELSQEDERRGLEVFMRAGCRQCHAIRGTPANGNAGPDLSHVGSRKMIGASLLPNTRANLAGWIADPQAIKPGIKMPRSYLASDDLMALVSYLESRK